jgi:hypothetical protein
MIFIPRTGRKTVSSPIKDTAQWLATRTDGGTVNLVQQHILHVADRTTIVQGC